MEYERTVDGQIRAAFARRAGQLVLQYEALCRHLPVDEQFESTLAVALLQPMLTSCQELLRRGAGKKGPLKSYGRLEALAKRLVRDEPTLMGLKADCVSEIFKDLPIGQSGL